MSYKYRLLLCFYRYSYPEAQRHAYQDAINRYKTGTTWQIALDMDEYPVAPGDSGCGFLIRAIEGLNHRDTAELSIKTLLLVGKSTFLIL